MKIILDIPDTTVEVNLNFNYYDPISGQVYYDYESLNPEDFKIYNGKEEVAE